MKNLLFLFIALLGISLTSCERDDFSPPTIILNTPATLEFTASLGDTIVFEGRFFDPNELGYLEMTANHEGGGSQVIKTIDDLDSKKEHAIDEIFVLEEPFQTGDVIDVGFIGYDVPGNNTIARVTITIE